MEWDGVNIKLLAKEKGITLKQLAAEIGVTRQSVGDWVKGQLPKGNHLVALCKIFETTPNAFFYIEKDVGIAVPSHRTKGVAKVTPERQKYALQHATEYSVFFKNIEAPRIVPVVRAKDRSEASARTVAQKLRDLVGASKKEPITLEETFQLMENLGIYVIIKRFPETIKAYAFYTKIHSYRAVFVDYNTNFLDLIFALLHEAIHALRDEEVVDPSYDKNEEDFCDLVASHVQFPDEYIKLALNTISGLKTSHQVNKLKYLGKENSHALYGLVKQIKNLDPSFKLNISGADTNFKKEFKSIGEILFADDDVKSYIDTLRFVSPLFIVAIVAQLEGLSDRRLGELLGVDHILDAKAVRVELQLKTS
ncbi:MAG: helix-turn-helix transcriptional regulator [Deltaproteobacteria bacterium]|nr:helix-turn-helix transcriptional regulator [Deltaproteobacteria bacterium]